MEKYKVIRDTREKEGKGWTFSPSKTCEGTVVAKLDTGDYSIKGAEEIFCIERKGSITEFARNIVSKPFEKELERMNQMYFPYILLEFTMDDIVNFPKSAGLERINFKIKGSFILMKILEMEIRYGVHFMLCGQHGSQVASSLFKRMHEWVID